MLSAKALEWTADVQHEQKSHAFVIPAKLYALRTHPNMPQHRLVLLMERFNEAVSKAGLFSSDFAIAK